MKPFKPLRTPAMALADMLRGPPDIYEVVRLDWKGSHHAMRWVQQIGTFKRSWCLVRCPHLSSKPPLEPAYGKRRRKGGIPARA